MKRALVLAVILLVCVPSLSNASHILTFFPDNSAIGISTSAEVNGFTHLLMQASLNDFNLHAVFLGPTGAPDFVNAPLPWVFGQLVSIVQSGSNFTLTWNIFVGPGGTNTSSFMPAGTLVVTVAP